MKDEDYEKIDNSKYINSWWSPGRSRFVIALWRTIGMPVLKILPCEPYFERFFNDLKCSFLRLFGAVVGKGVVLRSCEIYYPWNLEIGDYAWIGYGANFYSLVRIKIGKHACISQNAFLCTGSHDPTDPYMGLVVGEITVGDGAWICASAFVLPGVSIGNGSVVAVGSVVTEDTPAMMVCAGIPCKPIKKREIRDIPPGKGGGIKKGKKLIPPEKWG